MLYISFLLSCFHLARTFAEAQRQVNLDLREGGFACACVPVNDDGGGGCGGGGDNPNRESDPYFTHIT